MSDELMIQAIIDDLADAWNAGDAPRYASHFCDDAATVTDQGAFVDGRAEVQRTHHYLFTHGYRGSTIGYQVESLRFLSESVALALLTAHLRFHEGSHVQESRSRPMLVLVRRNDRWCIAAFQNTDVRKPPESDYLV